jgi:hypothetical protein
MGKDGFSDKKGELARKFRRMPKAMDSNFIRLPLTTSWGI